MVTLKKNNLVVKSLVKCHFLFLGWLFWGHLGHFAEASEFIWIDRKLKRPLASSPPFKTSGHSCNKYLENTPSGAQASQLFRKWSRYIFRGSVSQGIDEQLIHHDLSGVILVQHVGCPNKDRSNANRGFWVRIQHASNWMRNGEPKICSFRRWGWVETYYVDRVGRQEFWRAPVLIRFQIPLAI